MNVELGVYYWQKDEKSLKELCLVLARNGEKIVKFFDGSRISQPFYGIFTEVEIVEKKKGEL